MTGKEWTDDDLDKLAAKVARHERAIRKLGKAEDLRGWAKILSAIATLMMGLGALFGPIIIALQASP